MHKIVRIFTEGDTERYYFESIRDELRLRDVSIEIIPMGTHHPKSIMASIVKEKCALSREDEEDCKTEWWAVFDRDKHPGFNDVINLAKQHSDIYVAYSNVCFELWILLHFQYMEAAIGQRDYCKKLSVLLGKKYEKNDTDIYDLIKDKEPVAIKNAKKLEAMHNKNGVKSPFRRDPSTTVYRLVERLRRLKK